MVQTTPRRVACVWTLVIRVDFQHPNRGDGSSSSNPSPEAPMPHASGLSTREGDRHAPKNVSGDCPVYQLTTIYSVGRINFLFLLRYISRFLFLLCVRKEVFGVCFREQIWLSKYTHWWNKHAIPFLGRAITMATDSHIRARQVFTDSRQTLPSPSAKRNGRCRASGG